MPVISAAQAGGKQICTMLDLVGFSEGTVRSLLTKDNGYDVEVSDDDGGHIFTDYSTHPFHKQPPAKLTLKNGTVIHSTAAGRYQLLLHYFDVYKVQLHLADFSPLSQDLIAIQQMKERHAIQPLLNGDVETAIGLLSSVWASFPGNNYGQGGVTLNALLNKWVELASNG